MSVEKLVEHFSTLEDPRCTGKVEHRLIDILVIVVCAVIACAENWMTLRSMAATSWAGCNPSGPNPDTDVFTPKNGRTAACFTR